MRAMTDLEFDLLNSLYLRRVREGHDRVRSLISSGRGSEAPRFVQGFVNSWLGPLIDTICRAGCLTYADGSGIFRLPRG